MFHQIYSYILNRVRGPAYERERERERERRLAWQVGSMQPLISSLKEHLVHIDLTL